MRALIVVFSALVASVASAFAQPVSLPSDRDIEEKVREQRARSAQHVEEAMRRMAIPQPAPMPNVPGSSASRQGVDPAKIADMYSSVTNRQAPNGQPVHEIYLLVSMSMPIESLRRFAVQSAKSGVPMIFRGFLHGMGPGLTEKSIEALRPLGELGAQVSINPNLFRANDIRQVPVLLVMGGASADCGSGECARPPLVVRGDASLDYLLEQVAPRRDPYGVAARAALARIRK